MVGEEHSNAARMGPGKGSFFVDDRVVVVALFLDFLFGGSMSLSDSDNIQVLGKEIKICVLDFRVITICFIGVDIDSTKL